jgi:hypothetical protein
LRSLEEFRKNHHVQIPSKSTYKISQSLAKKIQIHLKFKINFHFETFSGNQPSLPELAHLASQAVASPLSPASPRRLGVFAERYFPFRLAHSTEAPLLFPDH